MGSSKMDEVSVADGPTDQSRREALRRFGRYAAIAPSAMLLLEPREGHAGKKNGFGGGKRGGRGRGWNSGY